jgi:hypothetical protein
MSKTIFRQKRSKNYTTIPNEIFWNSKLSWKAKGMLGFLLSLPPDWEIFVSHLKTVSTDGNDSTVAGMSELIENKYVWRRSRGGANPGGWEYYVYDEPHLEDPFRHGKIPTRENPESGKSVTTKEKNIEQNIEEETNCESLSEEHCSTPPSVASKETPPADAAKRPSPDCAAPLPELEANKTKVNQMFRRRDNTVWSDKERKALENTLGTTEEEWETLIEYYSHAGEEGYYCRTAPLTAMNNWAGEIDKAKLDKKRRQSAKPISSETNKLAGGIAGREDEFWAWVHSKRPWEERRPTRAVPEEWVWDFLHGTKDEDLF